MRKIGNPTKSGFGSDNCEIYCFDLDLTSLVEPFSMTGAQKFQNKQKFKYKESKLFVVSHQISHSDSFKTLAPPTFSSWET